MVLPFPFAKVEFLRGLNPLERISKSAFPVVSALDKSGESSEPTTLYGSLDVSSITQSTDTDEFLISKNLGLNPRYTKGPSLDPLPVYEPKAEYPATGAKQ